MRIHFYGRATASLRRICKRKICGDEYAGRRREEDTLSRIDSNSEDGIRSFSIKTGRIHASYDPPEMDAETDTHGRSDFRHFVQVVVGTRTRDVYLNHRAIGRPIVSQTARIELSCISCFAAACFIPVFMMNRTYVSRIILYEFRIRRWRKHTATIGPRIGWNFIALITERDN